MTQGLIDRINELEIETFKLDPNYLKEFMFKEKCLYERINTSSLEEAPLLECVFANEKGGVLEFKNTNRLGDNIWVIQEAKSYKQVEFTVEEHARKIAVMKRTRFLEELEELKEKEIEIMAKISEINNNYPL